MAIYTEVEQQERFARLNRAVAFAPSEPLGRGPAPPEARRAAGELIAAGRMQDALALLDGTPADDETLLNLRGVCLLRLGKASAALSLFRPLVLSSVTSRLRPGVPDAYAVNFATALLLSGNVGGARRFLDEFGRDDLPAVARLRSAIEDWQRSLSPVRKLLAAAGIEPEQPVTLSFPPGETE